MILKFSSKSEATATCVLLFSPLLLMAQHAYEPCPSISEEEKCPAGCWLLDTEIDFPFAKRQCSSVGYGYFSEGNDNTRLACPPGTFSDSHNAQVCQQCEAGAYAPSIGSRFCNLCPAGSFSGIPGSYDCRPCLDVYFKQRGANAVEFWDGQYYCTYIASSATFVSSTISTSATTTELQTSTPISTVPTLGRSEEPTYRPSSSPSSSPSNTLSHFPLTDDIEGTVIVQEDQLLASNTTLLVCDDFKGQFEWYGLCKQCPAKLEEGLYPFLIFILFGVLMTVLQSFVPLCFTSTVWAGMEYLQVLYLVSLCGISWPPFAATIFEKVIPVFGLDFSTNFSLQCVFGWPKEYDQVLMITLPLLFWFCVIAFSKLSRDPLITYKSGIRWLIIYLYLGFAIFLRSSYEVCELYHIFATFSSPFMSPNWYTSIAGIAGLTFYGLVFPQWLYQTLGRYNDVVTLGIEERKQDDSKCHGKNRSTCSCLSERKNVTYSSYANLLLTLGIFPSVRESAWWWPLLWMIRKMGFIVLVAILPQSPALLLVLLLVTLFLSEIFQRCVTPFPNKCEERMGNRWFHSTTVDAVLQVCSVGMVGLGILIVDSKGMRTTGENLVIDVLVLFLFSASIVFWLLALGFACTTSCQDCPRFATFSMHVLEKAASLHEADDDDESVPGDRALEEVSLDDTPLGIRSAEFPISEHSLDGMKWRPTFSIPPTIAMLRKSGLYGEEMNLERNDREASTQFHRIVGEEWIDSENGTEIYDKKTWSMGRGVA
jgi:hypothetical protein